MLVRLTLDRETCPGHCVLCSWARYFTLTVPLSIQEKKWAPNCQVKLDKMLGGYLQWTSIPFRRSRNTPSLSCYGIRDKLWQSLGTRLERFSPYLSVHAFHSIWKRMVKIDCEICCHIVASRQTIANFFLIF